VELPRGTILLTVTAYRSPVLLATFPGISQIRSAEFGLPEFGPPFPPDTARATRLSRDVRAQQGCSGPQGSRWLWDATVPGGAERRRGREGGRAENGRSVNQGLYVAYARVRGRNSDNTRLRKVLSWEPTVSLEDGLGRAYGWIEDQVRQRLNGAGGTPAARG